MIWNVFLSRNQICVKLIGKKVFQSRNTNNFLSILDKTLICESLFLITIQKKKTENLWVKEPVKLYFYIFVAYIWFWIIFYLISNELISILLELNLWLSFYQKSLIKTFKHYSTKSLLWQLRVKRIPKLTKIFKNWNFLFLPKLPTNH